MNDGKSLLPVTNNGFGFEERKHDRVFDLFKGPHTQAEGSGISLQKTMKIKLPLRAKKALAALLQCTFSS